jgi:hypothetical protein
MWGSIRAGPTNLDILLVAQCELNYLYNNIRGD